MEGKQKWWKKIQYLDFSPALTIMFRVQLQLADFGHFTELWFRANFQKSTIVFNTVTYEGTFLEFYTFIKGSYIALYTIKSR